MYKRYMVFGWYDYDNVSPFECVIGSYDDLSDAKESAIAEEEWYYDNIAIFDRIDGVFIK